MVYNDFAASGLRQFVCQGQFGCDEPQVTFLLATALYLRESWTPLELWKKARLEAGATKEVIERVKAGDTSLYEIIMRRYNQRLYRIARAILRDDSEAEDVIQDAYVRRFSTFDSLLDVHTLILPGLTRIRRPRRRNGSAACAAQPQTRTRRYETPGRKRLV